MKQCVRQKQEELQQYLAVVVQPLKEHLQFQLAGVIGSNPQFYIMSNRQCSFLFSRFIL